MSNPLYFPLYQKGDKYRGNPFIKRGTRFGGNPLPKGDKVWGSCLAVIDGNNVPQLRLPCEREDGRTNVYETAKVGYILNRTTYRGALFKGSWQVGAIATTCLRVSIPFYV